MKKKIEVGQKIRVIADTFTQDPHGLPIGSEWVVERINPATKFDDMPPFIKFMAALSGAEKVDLPERVHVKTGEGHEDFANLVFDDFEVVHDLNGRKIRMLEDDFVDGFKTGDVFEVFWSESEEEYLFTDREGDPRPLDCHEYELV